MITTLAVLVAFLSVDAQPPQAAPTTTPLSREAPKVVSTVPANGARDVDPGLKEIRITFDQEMKTDIEPTLNTYNWFYRHGPALPSVANGYAKGSWAPDHKTWLLPVKLDAGRFYCADLSLVEGFSGANGTSVTLGRIFFVTSGASATELAKIDPPKIFSLLPADGATNVVPGPTTLIVKFDKPMWFADRHYRFAVLDGEYPVTLGDPKWHSDTTVCTLPVDLKPRTTYKIGLNEKNDRRFLSAEGIPFEPVVWTFTTGEK